MKQDRLLCTAALRINVPPTYDHYMEWGFFDGSVRFYATDSRKVGLQRMRRLDSILTALATWTFRTSPRRSTISCMLC